MVCPRCLGEGVFLHKFLGELWWAPCPECQGRKIVSCCDTAGAGRNPADLATTIPDWREKAAGAPSEARQMPILSGE